MKKKNLLVILFSVFSCLVFAEGQPIQASDACFSSAKLWAIKAESKQTATKIDKIRDSETKLLGSGANLFLVSVFVDGPSTADHTHWEVVGEFNYKTNACKIIIGRRYQAP